jgi:hypothetical protein
MTITAIFEQKIDISINTPENNPIFALLVLSQKTINIAALIRNSCADYQGSSLVVN